VSEDAIRQPRASAGSLLPAILNCRVDHSAAQPSERRPDTQS
jgi:hypothetical protein